MNCATLNVEYLVCVRWFTWCHLPDVLLATKTQTHQHPLHLVGVCWLDEIESNDQSLNIAIRQFIYLFIQLNTLIAAAAPVSTGNCVVFLLWSVVLCVFFAVDFIERLSRDANLMIGNIPNSMNHKLNWAIKRDIFRTHFFHCKQLCVFFLSLSLFLFGTLHVFGLHFS